MNYISGLGKYAPTTQGEVDQGAQQLQQQMQQAMQRYGSAMNKRQVPPMSGPPSGGKIPYPQTQPQGSPFGSFPFAGMMGGMTGGGLRPPPQYNFGGGLAQYLGNLGHYNPYTPPVSYQRPFPQVQWGNQPGGPPQSAQSQAPMDFSSIMEMIYGGLRPGGIPQYGSPFGM